jgi:NAD(P)-dependent dehydrogenase (short-subunit alcohol dehydrogenase family)
VGERLAGKVTLITGAGSGIGEATARLFAREGAVVVALDVREESARRVAADIAAGGGQASALTADVSRPDDAARAISEAVARYGHLDVLFNNAGVSAVGDVAQCSPEEWDRVMAVNVRGVYLMSHFAVPVMRRQGGGVIVQMSSAIALMGLEARAAYAASKGAVLALTRAMAADHSRDNIRVAALLPGTVMTPFVEGYLATHYAARREEAEANLRRRQLNNRLLSPDDVAEAALFLASDAARFALGTALVVDGGLTAAKVF